MSLLPTLDCNGTCSRYRANSSASPQDALQILADHGLNTVRLRLFGPGTMPNSTCDSEAGRAPRGGGWATPCAADAVCAWNKTCEEIEAANEAASYAQVLAMARRAKRAGLKITLDIFYDSWCDCMDDRAGCGMGYDKCRLTPAPWRHFSFPTLLKAVYDYTHEVVTALVMQGTTPQSVQIGNEVDCGLMYAWPDMPCSVSGEICASQGMPGRGHECPPNWGNMEALVKAGSKAVRAASPGTELIIQLGASLDLAQGGNYSKLFYTNMAKAGVEFDAFGLSFYQVWGAERVADVCAIAQAAQALPDKRIYVIETGYPHRHGGYIDTPHTPNTTLQFGVSPAGQLAWLRALVWTVTHGLGGRGAGVGWWGTEYANPCSNEQCAGLWDQHYVALPALTERGFDAGKEHTPPTGAVVCPPLEVASVLRV